MSLAAPEPPEGFEEFWEEALLEAFHAPLDGARSMSQDAEGPDGQIVETLAFRGMDGTPRYGWLAYPPYARRLPAFLWIPPYGRESKLPDAYGTRAGMVSMSFNFHGESAFHQEAYRIPRGYFAEGAADPATWIFRRMFQDAVIAMRFLQVQIEADEDRLAAMGMSQGGGMAIWLGAWCPLVRAVCADMPFLSCIGHTLSQSVHRYPLKELVDFMDEIPLGRERVLNTLSHYDTATQARFCRVPTQVSLGLKDPACRPDTVRAAFDALPDAKSLHVYDWGHDWHPDMVANNAAWLAERLG